MVKRKKGGVMSELLSWLQSLQVLTIVLLAHLVWRYLSTYISKKGENLATKEDIATITGEIERVRQQYTTDLERLRASLDVISGRLRTAAVEKRLDKCQEAYTLWTELFWNIHDSDKLPQTVIKCQEWWVKNNLYLGSEASAAFKKAYVLANTFQMLPREQTDERERMFRDIEATGATIVSGAELPSLGEEEGRRV
jgi:hypothetical protein